MFHVFFDSSTDRLSVIRIVGQGAQPPSSLSTMNTTMANPSPPPKSQTRNAQPAAPFSLFSCGVIGVDPFCRIGTESERAAGGCSANVVPVSFSRVCLHLAWDGETRCKHTRLNGSDPLPLPHVSRVPALMSPSRNADIDQGDVFSDVSQRERLT